MQDDISRLQDDARLLRPAIFIGVPRVWERVRESAQARHFCHVMMMDVTVRVTSRGV
jgi:hypothetical protein